MLCYGPVCFVFKNSLCCIVGTYFQASVTRQEESWVFIYINKTQNGLVMSNLEIKLTCLQ